jgi:hypothetical protein
MLGTNDGQLQILELMDVEKVASTYVIIKHPSLLYHTTDLQKCHVNHRANNAVGPPVFPTYYHRLGA